MSVIPVCDYELILRARWNPIININLVFYNKNFMTNLKNKSAYILLKLRRGNIPPQDKFNFKCAYDGDNDESSPL